MHQESLGQQAFEALYDDLLNVRPDMKGSDSILCPICLRSISRQEILRNGVEHIVPRNLVRTDSRRIANHGTLNQRCGITVLCRERRLCSGTSRVAANGCNGLKGSLYDTLWRRFSPGLEITDPQRELKHRHGVSILVMAYLGAFQVLGYEYILRSELDGVREQFDYPDESRTPWVTEAQVDRRSDSDRIIRVSTGGPFVIAANLGNDGNGLLVGFRRFRALLPGGCWSVKTRVSPLQLLLSNGKNKTGS